MKKIFTLIILCGALTTQAQTLDDIELFNVRDLHGTSRYTAMGGAFTSLGNDLSAVHVNPASAAVFRNSNFGLTLGFQSKQGGQKNFFNGSNTSSDFNLSLENLGLLASFTSGPYKKESRFGFAITSQKLADFNRTYAVTGTNALGAFGQGSLAYYWLRRNDPNIVDQGAIGLMGSELQGFGLNEEFAAFQAGILVAANDTLISDVGFGNASAGSSSIRYFKDESGSHNEIALSFGGETGDKLFYGVSLAFPFLNYRMEDQIREFNLPVDTFPFDATSYQLNRVNEIYGTGFNFKLGLIYKPIHWWRIGASFQSPSWYSVRQVYEFDVNSTFATGDPFQSDILSTGEYAYGLRTPAIYRLGTSIVFGRIGLISVDYEFMDNTQSKTYELIRFNSVSDNDLVDGNTDANNFFTASNTLRVGGEIKLGLVSLRAGYSNQSSIYNDPDDFRSGIQTISGGIGYQTKKYSVDLTYVTAKHSREDWVHPFASADLVSTTNTRNNILLGTTIRF